MKDVKQKHQQKLIENEIKKEQEKKYLEELTFKNSPEYSNWRSEISEQMTTTDVFYSTLPATSLQNQNTTKSTAFPAYHWESGTTSESH